MDSSGAPRTLYVGNLPRDLESPEQTLMDLFGKAGLILSVRICRDINSQNSLGYAYVNFQNPSDAERALQQLNYTEVPTRPGRELRVSWSARDPTARKRGAGNIFVKGLDVEMTNKQLHEYFSQFGPVLSANQAVEEISGKRRGYGCVHFQIEEDAKAAVAAANGKELSGHIISCNTFVKRAEREKEAEKTFVTVFIKNLKAETTEEDLATLTSPYGEVASVFTSTHPKFSTKFAIVSMKEHEQAVTVIDKLDGAVSKLCANDSTLFVARLRKKTERKSQGPGLFQNEGRNLYVKHLPDDITEERITTDFSAFGEIESVSMQKADNVFRGFAFVLFKTKEGADNAVRQLHQKMLYNRRPLYVALAQRRDARHKMLEEQSRNIMQPRAPFPMMWNQQMPPAMFPMIPPQMQMRMPPQFNIMAHRRPPMRQMNQAIRANQKMMRPNNMVPRAAAAGSDSLASIIASMTADERKNTLGERLYAQIMNLDGPQAAKITGMLLEMETAEIVLVLDDAAQLENKVHEAQQVLRQHEAAGH